jgi:hypothetical protein
MYYSLFKAKKFIFSFEDRNFFAMSTFGCVEKTHSNEVDPILLKLKSQSLQKK